MLFRPSISFGIIGWFINQLVRPALATEARSVTRRESVEQERSLCMDIKLFATVSPLGRYEAYLTEDLLSDVCENGA